MARYRPQHNDHSKMSTTLRDWIADVVYLHREEAARFNQANHPRHTTDHGLELIRGDL